MTAIPVNTATDKSVWPLRCFFSCVSQCKFSALFVCFDHLPFTVQQESCLSLKHPGNRRDQTTSSRTFWRVTSSLPPSDRWPRSYMTVLPPQMLLVSICVRERPGKPTRSCSKLYTKIQAATAECTKIKPFITTQLYSCMYVCVFKCVGVCARTQEQTNAYISI